MLLLTTAKCLPCTYMSRQVHSLMGGRTAGMLAVRKGVYGTAPANSCCCCCCCAASTCCISATQLGNTCSNVQQRHWTLPAQTHCTTGTGPDCGVYQPCVTLPTGRVLMLLTLPTLAIRAANYASLLLLPLPQPNRHQTLPYNRAHCLTIRNSNGLETHGTSTAAAACLDVALAHHALVLLECQQQLSLAPEVHIGFASWPQVRVPGQLDAGQPLGQVNGSKEGLDICLRGRERQPPEADYLATAVSGPARLLLLLMVVIVCMLLLCLALLLGTQQLLLAVLQVQE